MKQFFNTAKEGIYTTYNYSLDFLTNHPKTALVLWGISLFVVWRIS